MLLLRAGDTLSDKAAHRLDEVFATDDPTGKRQAVWKVKEQLRALLRTDSLAATRQPRKRTRCSWTPTYGLKLTSSTAPAAGGETTFEILIVPGATTGKVEADNTSIKQIKRTARRYRNAGNHRSTILMRSAVRTAA